MYAQFLVYKHKLLWSKKCGKSPIPQVLFSFILMSSLRRFRLICIQDKFDAPEAYVFLITQLSAGCDLVSCFFCSGGPAQHIHSICRAPPWCGFAWTKVRNFPHKQVWILFLSSVGSRPHPLIFDQKVRFTLPNFTCVWAPTQGDIDYDQCGHQRNKCAICHSPQVKFLSCGMQRTCNLQLLWHGLGLAFGYEQWG